MTTFHFDDPAQQRLFDAMKPSDLPAELADIARECGLPTALALAANFGGRRLYIPSADALTADHVLVGTLGQRRARALCQHFSPLRGDYLPVPNLKRFVVQARNRLIVSDHEQGAPVAALARRYGLHMRTAWQILAKRGYE